MEKEEYNNLIIDHKFNELANISDINDLVKYKYNNRFLIEYLLEKGIHSEKMDNAMKYSEIWILFYIEYNVSKPLINCYPPLLLNKLHGKLILDLVLSLLSNDDALLLLTNFKKNSYWLYHEHEKEIVDTYQKHNIKIPEIFISNSTLADFKITTKRKKIIEMFNSVFSDLDPRVLLVLNNEISYCLRYNYYDTYDDIENLIEYKKNNPDFKIILSNDTEGEYNHETDIMTISPYRRGVLFHELSHLLYHAKETNDEKVIEEYEEIRSSMDQPEVINRIIEYLNNFYQRYHETEKYYVSIYNQKIIQKYGSMTDYMQTIRKDIISNGISLIDISDHQLFLYIGDDNILETIDNLIAVEREQFVNRELKVYYTEELLFENLLDALLKGKIIDRMIGVEGISGHINRDFMKDDSLSFNECLADYASLKKTDVGRFLIMKLEELTSKELVMFLENYLTMNRRNKRR